MGADSFDLYIERSFSSATIVLSLSLTQRNVSDREGQTDARKERAPRRAHTRLSLEAVLAPRLSTAVNAQSRLRWSERTNTRALDRTIGTISPNLERGRRAMRALIVLIGHLRRIKRACGQKEKQKSISPSFESCFRRVRRIKRHSRPRPTPKTAPRIRCRQDAQCFRRDWFPFAAS